MRNSFAVALACIAIGCGSSVDETTGGTVDTGTVDTGTASVDSASTDSGIADSVATDSSASDSATSDTGLESDTAVDVGTDTPSGESCGGIVGKLCGKGQFCKAPAGSCGVVDGGGTCTPIPATCTKESDPVCACDGTTYGNPCLADKAMATVDHKGACPLKVVCGGKKGDTCASGEFCDFPDGAACGGFDSTGICTAKPSICPTIVSPVCACNGMSYGNACKAHKAGFDDSHAGECP